jgi:hypothetical protein
MFKDELLGANINLKNIIDDFPYRYQESIGETRLPGRKIQYNSIQFSISCTIDLLHS